MNCLFLALVEFFNVFSSVLKAFMLDIFIQIYFTFDPIRYFNQMCSTKLSDLRVTFAIFESTWTLLLPV